MSSFKFLGFQSTATPARSALGTGFPAPYQDTTLDAESFQTAIPLVTLLEWYWMHNELKVDSDLVIGGTAFTTATSTPQSISSLGWPELIFPAPKLYTFSDNGITIRLTLFAGGGDGAPYYHPTVGKLATTFYPAILVNDDAGSVEFRTKPSMLSAAATGTISMNILGFAFTIYYYNSGGPFTGSFFNVTLVSEFSY